MFDDDPEASAGVYGVTLCGKVVFSMGNRGLRWTVVVARLACTAWALTVSACSGDNSGPTTTPDGGGAPDSTTGTDGATGTDGSTTTDGGGDAEGGSPDGGTAGDTGSPGDSGAGGGVAIDGSSAESGDSGGAATLTNGTLFRVDSTGTNLDTVSSTHVGHGVWSTLAGVQNIPGNYGGHLFLSTASNPGPNDFLALSTPLASVLSPGANTFYFFANSDDPLGGNYGFGMNLWLDGAAASNPSISVFTAVPGDGGSFGADGTAGCTGGFDDACYPGASTLSWLGAASTVTLTSFSVGAVGGATASATCVDKVGGNNTAPTIVNMPDGICDTVGSFTLTVQ